MFKYLDREKIFHFFEEEEMVSEMLGLILATNIRELKNLKSIYDSGDYERLRKTCHKSKPTMLYLGSTYLRDELEQVERNIPEKFEDLYPPFLDKIAELEAEIGDFLREISNE
ncbi:hypothetical protein ADIS_2926 [Lunatimonas lonarensis]|uniref:HPt domain-containing protein n=1 Tax=Lunatimonas lonarensis TaxID=1232681 RepID=R7ZQS6_9BACT|nr:hypothetical protein [Lunatimonas lonarensis]EON76476.1 hypothetical protein ADIS_2926 [Lunatimonas lonarensis]